MHVRSAEFAADPYPYYRAMRDAGGVHYLAEESAWLVVKYELASSILRQPLAFSAEPYAEISPSLHGAGHHEHGAMRKILGPFFTPERQVAQKDSIIARTSEAIDKVTKLGHFDAVADLAVSIPFSVTCDWLGLEEDSARCMHGKPIPQVTWPDVERALLATGVIPDLLRMGELPKAQIAELAAFLFAASYGTSRDFLLLSLSVLMKHRDVVDQVLMDMSLLPGLIEELLRLEPAAHTLLRRTLSDVVLEQQTIPAGSMIWISIAAANRDPAVFESPEELRLDRTTTRHLAFGIGPRFCMGSPLARLESAVILEAVLPLVRQLESAGPLKIQFWNDFPGGAPSSRQITSWPMRIAPRGRSR